MFTTPQQPGESFNPRLIRMTIDRLLEVDDQSRFSAREVSYSEVPYHTKESQIQLFNGSNDIPLKYIGLVSHTFARQLTCIINSCIRGSYFPNA